MSDPAVCCFLTKTLCAQGGRLGLPQLREHIGLSAQQLEETLSAAGPQRFLVLRDGGEAGVLAMSAVRLCVRRECKGCERLHLCKLHLMGRCHLGPRSCKYSHDIISAENKKVLKTHELFGLNENELRVLLLQNDPFLLPDVCLLYNRRDGACSLQSNCNKLHICRHFLQGECTFFPCKKSHNLLDTHALRVLENGGIDRNIASNIQTIYHHKYVELNKELKKGRIHNYKPRENVFKKPAVIRVKELRTSLQTVGSTLPVPPSEGPSSNVPGQSEHQLPTGAGGRDKGPSSNVPGQSEHQLPTGAGGRDKGPSSNVPGQSEHQLPTGAGGRDKDKKDDSSAKASKDNEDDECDEICVFYVWKYCKHKNKCRFVHYHLPYRWQVHNGITWKDLSMMEEIEKAYCDPKISSIADKNIDFQTMTCSSSSLRRLSTPSSVTKPTFALTTQWIWYWKNDQGQWIEYGQQGEGNGANSPSSDILENLYLAAPGGTVPFQAGLHHYELSFKEMIQTNKSFKTRRQVRRRPKFVSFEDVQKTKKGQRDSSIPNQACPVHWDQSALPDFGYKAVEISNTTSEYNKIKQLFLQTMRSYEVLRIRRIQNPSLWKVFQWQKEQMKRENGGKEVNEKLLFHGTKASFVEAICIHNFDWRICGSNGTNYGKGSYFARDASYSHAYCQAVVKPNIMFVARVLVGNYVKGNTAYVRPPTKSADGLRFYDSCVDDESNPSIFVVFEKYQIYPEYLIEYREEEKKCIIC
ncbi:protein mono-ADP-ribosyltransferase PARP12-like isoform 2-T2 [Morus bassanus]